MNTQLARWLAGAAGALLLGLVGVLAIAMARGIGGPDEGRSEVNAAAATFQIEQFDGETFDLQAVSDRPVFVYFWASWCYPCEEEAPVIQRLWTEEYRDRGYVFLGVNMWDTNPDARAFIERHGLTFPVAADAGGAVYVEYGVQGLPTAYFIEPGLQIRTRYDGALDESTLRTLLDEIAGGTRERS
ncbi:MAG: TlpA disulfide reductase family protein [Chloroflexi bacterium]|nr:TlpA disulfide reductase family protein [Chloroflexota bacterium]MDA1240058.1 TlpA disulfide reductase family protein [Chloroflexota bacterium]MQC25581.1 TlpA family protein disulfide reductase [Chloroflexota bacterium]MQC48126.1 TlpA family protein disulfide reductase [Chloroflexota bacterium]